MIREDYGTFEDPYTYTERGVLRNRLGIREQGALDAFEVEITTLRAEEPLPDGRFDAAHYCNVHHHLFQDVYEWAGQYRTVRIAKGTSAFCYPEHIPAQMEALFDSLRHGEVFAGLNRNEFVERTARFLGELNAIHPFREGNGRVQLSFLGLIGASSGHPLHFERLDREAFLDAMIASYSGDARPLMNALESLLIDG